METPKIFKNNGHLRGLIYVGLPAVSTIGAAFATWADAPPKNFYVIGVVLCATIVNAGTALRGYLDQHLSRAAEEGEPSEVNTDTVIIPKPVVTNPITGHK
jgi:hypothetical protein